MTRAPLHMDSPMSEWDAEAERLGVASGEIYRQQVLLADEIIMGIIVEEQRRERMQKANKIARARLAALTFSLTGLTKRLGLVVGSRIRLRSEFECYPNFIVDAGAMGTVSEITDDLLSVKMDEHIHGCEEWDNELHWYSWDQELIVEQLEKIP